MIISIENHCNKAQQSKMARIFRAIFDDTLPTEDLVYLEGRERLPSPQELQGKIILKGSYKRDEVPYYHYSGKVLGSNFYDFQG